jgi:hypothetical protein
MAPIPASQTADVGADWQMVRKYESAVAINARLDATPSTQFKDFATSLVLVHAYAVLQQALLELRDQGRISKCRGTLGSLMDASEGHVDWRDLPKVRQGKAERDAVAHGLKVVPRGECWAYIRAVEAELSQWGFLRPNDLSLSREAT